MRDGARFVVAAIAITAIAVVCAACGDSASPGGSGNTVIDDTRDQPRPPANPDTPVDSGPTDGEAPIYDGSLADGAAYQPLSACSGCTCSADSHYCFGGGRARAAPTPQARDASAEDGGDASLPACPLPASASTIQVGCNDLPAECAATPRCACVLNAIQPHFACYLVCQPGGDQLRVYCPSP